jgi:glycosyltransferase involved in cell wall biosynthesis
MINRALVSINLPAYNNVRYIKQAIESALQQTYSNWELNIVDNCSTDGTWEIICYYRDKDSRIRAFQNAKNMGMVFSWNRLIQLSRGDFVCYLASDDWYAPNRLERLVDFMQINPDYWGVCDYLVEVDSNGKRIHESGFFENYFNRDVYGGDFDHALVNCINPQAIGMFKRTYYDEVGEFEEGVVFCDMRMHIRILAKGLRIGSLPEQLHFKRQHGESATSKMTDGLTYECFYLFKHVYWEIYLKDRNPKRVVPYIKWLLFDRMYYNIEPAERRRLLDYVTGTDFPFETYAEFLSHIKQDAPSTDGSVQQKTAKADLPHSEVLRELVHVLAEKCLERPEFQLSSLPEQLQVKLRHADSATSKMADGQTLMKIVEALTDDRATTKMTDGLTYECFYLFKYVYRESLSDRNPKRVVPYIKWLLFERMYHNIEPGERRRLLDYVTGTDFPFENYTEFLSHIRQDVPSADGMAQWKTAKADSGHSEMLRELVDFLSEKCLERPEFQPSQLHASDLRPSQLRRLVDALRYPGRLLRVRRALGRIEPLRRLWHRIKQK